MKFHGLFDRASRWIATKSGSPITFMAASGIIVVWLVTGPIFNYSDTWQLVINTGTSVITFLMVFIIQNTQNKDTSALHIKIAELIRATEGAHNALIDLEGLADQEIEKIRKRYCELAHTARKNLRNGTMDTNKPDVEEDFDIA